ncbi:MAG: hypothetical protein ACLSA6_03255 [Holdemania massiliensis]
MPVTAEEAVTRSQTIIEKATVEAKSVRKKLSARLKPKPMIRSSGPRPD